MSRAAVVFTFRSIQRMCSEGGTQAWRMHQSHFGTFDYVICARNRRTPDVEGPEEHGSAFLIGKVRGIVPSPEDHDPAKPRYLILMSEAAIIRDKPNFWKWGRWPTHFDDLKSLGVNPSDYDFKPLPDLMEEIRKTSGDLTPKLPLLPSPVFRGWRDAIERAKASLAAELGVEIRDIEITVRM